MKLIAKMAILVTVGTGARAEPVSVCMQNNSVVPARVMTGTQVLANEIFAAASVEIQWHRCEPSLAQSRHAGLIWIEMSAKTPKKRMPGVLAFTLLGVQGRITVFYDRVREATQFELTPNALLAHVLVHEIAHILQGSSRHSDGGVMKATFTPKDIKAMRHGPLRFGAEDVQSIRAGLAERTDAAEVVTVFPTLGSGINGR